MIIVFIVFLAHEIKYFSVPKSGPVIPESILAFTKPTLEGIDKIAEKKPEKSTTVNDARGRKPRYTDIPVTNIRGVIGQS